MTRKAQTRQLWQLCFDDTDAFLDLYFTERYRDGLNYVVNLNNRVVSALQTIPYTMKCFQKHFPVAYISGACTDPEHRRRGAMEQLLNDVHLDLFRKGVWLSTLIPSDEYLWSYYRRASYAPVFVESVKEISPEDINAELLPTYGVVKELKRIDEDVYEFFRAECEKRTATILHDAVDLNIVVKDLLLDEGTVLAFYEFERIIGIAFAKPKEDYILVTELIAEDVMAEQALLLALFNCYALPKIICNAPVHLKTNMRPKGMARIINAFKLLTLYAAQYPDDSMYIDLYDPLIAENNGHYFIRHGHCVRGIFPQFSAESYTIDEFAQLIFDREKPFMNLMLE